MGAVDLLHLRHCTHSSMAAFPGYGPVNECFSSAVLYILSCHLRGMQEGCPPGAHRQGCMKPADDEEDVLEALGTLASFAR